VQREPGAPPPIELPGQPHAPERVKEQRAHPTHCA
jgi:hypothetical protein